MSEEAAMPGGESFEPAVVVEGSLARHFGDDNAEEIEAKGDLLARIYQLRRDRSFNNTQLAAALGIDKSDVSKLLNGKLERFTIERMMRMLRHAGAPVRITFAPVDTASAKTVRS